MFASTFIGNEEVQDVLKKYLEQASSGVKDSPSFFLLQGPKHLWKSSIVRHLLNEIMGRYFVNDFLHIRDLSKEIWKQHNLKISLPDDRKKQFIELLGGQLYEDLWTREITKRLQQAPSGKLKVVLLENIERMTIWAANAFLKTCEEPLEKRIIIATTSNPSALLDTIKSRAILVKFHALLVDELMTFCDQKELFIDDQEFKELICRMVMWKPGLLMRYAQVFAETPKLQKQFVELVHLLSEGKQIYQTHRLLLKLKDEGMLQWFLDAWIAYAADHKLESSATERLKVKKMTTSNVNIEHLLLYGFIW